MYGAEFIDAGIKDGINKGWITSYYAHSKYMRIDYKNVYMVCIDGISYLK